MTTIEHVAKAIKDAHDRDAWSPYEKIGHEVALECARAAVETLRVLTAQVWTAGRMEIVSNVTGSGDGGWGAEIDSGEPTLTWQAMIDAILEEKP